ncbi:MAG: hypothetical protein IT389_08525 [Nitrospira sp.]|nr:hypothetical protein [Nitrospira sp.]
MNNFKYRVYYEYLGPSKDDPFATKPLSPDRVRTLLNSLCTILPDHYSSTVKDNSLYVAVITSETEEETDAVIERLVVKLNLATPGLSLLIERLSEK